MKKENKIMVYSTHSCPYCVFAKDFLKENKIKFTEKMVDDDPMAAKEMIEKSQQYGVPVIDINGKIIVGFDKESIKKELKLR